MAQTIQIKRSTDSSAPSTLANGELAYVNNSSLKKLYIGRPGGTTGDIDVIGGKDFTDKLDGIASGANNYTLPVSTTSAIGGIQIGFGLDISARNYPIVLDTSNKAYVNVPWTDTTYSLPTATDSVLGGVKIGSGISITDGVISSDSVSSSAVSSAGALMKTGGTMTGDLVLGTSGSTQAKISSASDLPLEFVGNLTFNTTLGNTLNYQLEGTNKMEIVLSSVAPSASPPDTTVEEIIFSAEEHTSTNSKFRFRTRNSDNTDYHNLVEFDHASTGSKHYHEDVVAFSTQTGGLTTASHGDSSQWNAAYGYGNHASAGYVSSSGTTFTGDVTWGDGKKAIFGSASDGLMIYNTASGNKKIEEKGDGNIQISGKSVQIHHSEDTDSDTDTGLIISEVGGNDTLSFSADTTEWLNIGSTGLRFGTYTEATTTTDSATITSVADEDDMATNSDKMLCTQQSIKAYADTKIAATALGNFTFSSDTMACSGATMTLDPSADGGTTGSVVIEGDLRVKGTTTTVDSTTVSIGDNIIVLNSDEAGTPSESAGFEVERGTATNAKFLFNETSDFFTLDPGTGTASEILTAISTIDGGTF